MRAREQSCGKPLVRHLVAVLVLLALASGAAAQVAGENILTAPQGKRAGVPRAACKLVPGPLAHQSLGFFKVSVLAPSPRAGGTPSGRQPCL